MSPSTKTTDSDTKRLLLWVLSFIGFPLGGLAGIAVAGPVDDLGAAVLGGSTTGLVIGIGQALASRGRLDPLRWALASALGGGLGLGLGGSAVGYQTSIGDLALMGLLTGIPLGVAQALALPRPSRRWRWALAVPPLWALGWIVTTAVGIDVDAQYTVFGATGALTFSVLSGLVLHRVVQPTLDGAPGEPSPTATTTPGDVRGPRSSLRPTEARRRSWCARRAGPGAAAQLPRPAHRGHGPARRVARPAEALS